MVGSGLLVNEVLRVEEPTGRQLGLDGMDEDRLILAFTRWAEGQLKRWLDYAGGALLFVVVPGDPESGLFYIYDRGRRKFWMVDAAGTDRYGGYRLEEFEDLAQVLGLKALAQNPGKLLGMH